MTPPSSTKHSDDGNTMCIVQYALSEEYSDSDSDTEMENKLLAHIDTDSKEEIFVTPPESPLPRIYPTGAGRPPSDIPSDESDDWDCDELEDLEDSFTYTTTDSGVNSPDTSIGGNDLNNTYSPSQRSRMTLGPCSNTPPNRGRSSSLSTTPANRGRSSSPEPQSDGDMSSTDDAELTAIMDNYEASERELEGVR